MTDSATIPGQTTDRAQQAGQQEGQARPDAIRIHPDDNVLVSTRTIRAGEEIRFEGGTITARDDIPLAHKIALQDLPAGTKILRYGAPIGSVTADIACGGHVHMHNAKSDYIRTHNREGT